jgi:hypothetical protein
MLRFPQHSHDEEARWSANQVSFVQAYRVDPPNVLDQNHVTETTRPDFRLIHCLIRRAYVAEALVEIRAKALVDLRAMAHRFRAPSSIR